MRKQKIFLLSCLCLSVMLGSIGCKKEETESKALVSLAENGIKKVEAPQGCEIISNPAEYTPVTEDQSYHFETDTPNYQTVSGLAVVEEKMFNMDGGYLYYYDKDQDKYNLLCDKPDCTHVMEDAAACSAYVYTAEGLAYAEGSFYTITSEKIELVKISLDGTTHEVIKNLCPVPEEDIVNEGRGSYSITWIVHRGYIYYYYTLYSGATEDIYYLNGSNCLYRMALDGSSEPECILPFVCEGVADGMFAFDCKGNVIAYIPWIFLRDEQIIDVFCGISDNRLYFLRVKKGKNPWISIYESYAIPYYIETEDLADGEYEIHEAKK